METLTYAANSVTSAATKAIWGEPTQTSTEKSTEPLTDTSTDPSAETSTETSTEPKHETVTESKPETPSTTAVNADAPPPSTDETAGAATSKHEGADVPQNEPSTKEESSAIQETKAEAEEAAKVVPKGPGPKPLSEVRSGAAEGHAAHDRSGGSADDEINEPSHGEGTGEKYVKSSGLKADGGDFDASAPGAGKEADRLLEEKGIHREPGGGSTSTETKDEDPLEAKMNKMSLKDKVKAKLGKSSD